MRADTTAEPTHLEAVQARLLEWFAEAGRDLPWRRTHDPYAILVSELMLQQTQAARVEPVFTAFLRRFPTVAALAAASPAAVVTAWRGLGYNRRAVALHRAARVIVAEHGGEVPEDLAPLRALPGVGEYTARAVLAFAFGRDAAPVDTNVARVLLRAVSGVAAQGRELQELADGAVPHGRGRAWNSALMDLGAGNCVARTPRCAPCPVREVCAWRAAGGPDPFATSASRPRAQGRFAGSDRWHRGRLVDALRGGPIVADRVPPAAGTHDVERAHRLATALVREGLAVWDGDELRLPG